MKETKTERDATRSTKQKQTAKPANRGERVNDAGKETTKPRKPGPLRLGEHVKQDIRKIRAQIKAKDSEKKQLEDNLRALQLELQEFMTPRTRKKEVKRLRDQDKPKPVPKTCCQRCWCLCCWMVVFVFSFFFLTWGSVTVWDQDYIVAQKVLDRVSDGLVVGLNETFGVRTMPRPGELLAAEGRKKRFPVVFIPGVISSGLEVWKAKPCAKNMFRQRLWGTASMMQKLAFDPKCWIEHIKLNGSTWSDPDGIKLRAASGLGAADYFITGYALWGKLIQNLADVGYDEDSMHLAAYDWRLPFFQLEKRDRYFTKLRRTIELLKDANDDQKVVVVGHSMGATVWMHFMQWVSQSQYGGRDWVADHIATFVSLAGSLLGAPKALVAAVSGEASDTVGLDSVSKFIKDSYLPAEATIDIFRSAGSIPSLFPMGGSKFWQADQGFRRKHVVVGHDVRAEVTCDEADNGKCAADGTRDATSQHDNAQTSTLTEDYFFVIQRNESQCQALHVVQRRANATSEHDSSKTESGVEIDESVDYRSIIAMIASSGLDVNVDGKITIDEFHGWSALFAALDANVDGEISGAELRELEQLGLGAAAPIMLLNETNFTMEAAFATLLKSIAPKYAHLVEQHYSFGIDPRPKPAGFTDRRTWANPLQTQLPYAPNMSIVCLYGVGIDTERAYAYRVKESQPLTFARSWTNSTTPDTIQPVLIDEGRSDESFKLGVQYGNGDGTVPLLSLGFMCEKGWPESRAHNPAMQKDQFVVREYNHDPNRNINIRDITWLAQGGATTADHVNILGNNALLEDIVRMATSSNAITEDGHKTQFLDEQWLPQRRVLSELEDMAAGIEWPPQ